MTRIITRTRLELYTLKLESKHEIYMEPKKWKNHPKIGSLSQRWQILS